MKWNTAYHIYEVLALLIIALSWWSYITNRFIDNELHWQSFNDLIERSVAKAQVASYKADSALKAEARKNGNSREDKERIKRAALLQKRTNEVIAFLEDAKNHLKKIPKEARKQTSDWMIEQGKAHQIKKKLDTYIDWLAKEHKDLDLPKFEKIAEGNERNALYFAWENNRDFAHTYFAYTSPIEAATVLSLKQTIVKRYEAEVLKKLGAGDISTSCCFGCYRLQPVVFASTKVIPVGDAYTADMFIRIPIIRGHPRISINQTPLVVRDGQANVAFQTQGIGKQFWEGKITIQDDGKDTTFVHRMSLEVIPK